MFTGAHARLAIKSAMREVERWSCIQFSPWEGERDYESFEAYKKVQKEVQKSVRRAKRNFERKIAKEKNKKAFYSYMKKKTSNRVSVGPLKDGEELVTENIDGGDAQQLVLFGVH